MTLVETTDPGRDARLARYEREGWPTSIAERCHGLATMARDASPEATVAALGLAATPAGSESEFADKVAVLRAHAESLPGFLRAHVTALAEAALAAEILGLVSSGQPPHGRRIGGWLGDVPHLTSRHPEIGASEVVALRTAAQDLLVDATLEKSILVVSDLKGLPPGGVHAAGAYATIEKVAFALCAEPAASRAAFDGMRRTGVILWRTLRRRRPLAAAVIRATLLRDRRRLMGATHRVSKPMAPDAPRRLGS